MTWPAWAIRSPSMVADGASGIEDSRSGGRLDIATCTEQLLYEMHDPASLHHAGLRGGHLVCASRAGRAGSRGLSGPRGPPRTSTYKVVVGYFDGYMGKARCASRASTRWPAPSSADRGGEGAAEARGFAYPEMRVDLIGMNSCMATATAVVARTVRGATAHRRPHDDRQAAEAVGSDVRSLHMQGRPAPAAASDFGARRFWR